MFTCERRCKMPLTPIRSHHPLLLRAMAKSGNYCIFLFCCLRIIIVVYRAVGDSSSFAFDNILGKYREQCSLICRKPRIERPNL